METVGSEQVKRDTLSFLSVAMGSLYRSNDTTALSRCIESIQKQTFTNFEFLICDDGSSTAAMELLDRYAERDTRIRLIRPGNKILLPQKLNACITEAQGEYIARMDDDDVSHPDRFEKQLDFLLRHPEVGFVGCNVNLSRNNVISFTRELPKYPTVKDFYVTQPYVHPTLIFRKAVLDLVGGYCEEPYCDLCEDYDLLLRMYICGVWGVNLQEPLLDYSLPAKKTRRKMRHRMNEARVRWKRFCQLKLMPGALPFVIKPLATGLLPTALLNQIKRQRGTG